MFPFQPRFILTVLLGMVALMSTSPTAFAQTSPAETCPVTVRDVFTQLDQMCNGLERNQACYVADDVIAAFYEAISADTFAEPADRVGIASLRELTTSPYNEQLGQLGAAVMRLQANLPNTLPGQGVIFIVVGDVSVQNRVNPDDVVVLDDPIDATVNTRANVRSGPSTTFNVLAAIEAGGEIAIDARAETGRWLRGLYDGRPVWVFAALVNFAGDIDALPVLTDTRYGAMQAFVMQSGIGGADCEDAPNSMLVQTPQGVQVTLNVNGLDVTVGSTVLFDTPDDQLRISVLDGSATLANGLVVRAGNRITGPLGDDDLIESESAFDLGNIDSIDESEWPQYDKWDDIESTVLNYPLDFDEESFFEAATVNTQPRNVVPNNGTGGSSGGGGDSGDDDDDGGDSGGGGDDDDDGDGEED